MYTIYTRYLKFTLYEIVTHDLCKTEAPFWGGVEVSWSYTSLGHALLPKAVRFPPLLSAPLLFLSIGTTQQRWSLWSILNNVHLLASNGNTRTRSTNQTDGSLRCISLKIVKSTQWLTTWFTPSWDRTRRKPSETYKRIVKQAKDNPVVNWSQTKLTEQNQSSRHLPRFQE